MDRFWNGARVARLRKAWDEGLSASQCADAIGDGCNRNMVIGKVRRLGLSSRKAGRRSPQVLARLVERNKTICDLYRRKVPIKLIARAVGISYCRVDQILTRSPIKRNRHTAFAT